MTNLPIDMQLINDQNQLTLSSGETEINYLFSTPIITVPVDSSSESNYLIYVIVGGIVASAIIATIIRVKQKTTKLTQKQ